jgi:hypothetical protein
VTSGFFEDRAVATARISVTPCPECPEYDLPPDRLETPASKECQPDYAAGQYRLQTLATRRVICEGVHQEGVAE